MSPPVVFDIETGSLPPEALSAIVPPFVPDPHPGEFNPANVKYGNAKKEDTRLQILEAARIKHAEAVASYSLDVETKEREYWAKVEADAALSATTGEVLAIGYKGEKVVVDFQTEAKSETQLIATFWKQYKTLRSSQRKLIGFNINGFDIPFLVQRSWILGIPVPETLFNGPQRYLEPTFVDLMKVWGGGSWGTYIKLDTVARALGLKGKTPGVNGGDFARLFRDPETTGLAIDYAINDVEVTFNVADRMGFV